MHCWIVTNVGSARAWVPGVGLIDPTESIEVPYELAVSLTTHHSVPGVVVQQTTQEQWESYVIGVHSKEDPSQCVMGGQS